MTDCSLSCSVLCVVLVEVLPPRPLGGRNARCRRRRERPRPCGVVMADLVERLVVGADDEIGCGVAPIAASQELEVDPRLVERCRGRPRPRQP